MHESDRQPVVLGGVQIHAVTGRREDNLRRVEDQLKTMAERGVALAVLPELFSYGYVFDSEYAEALSGPTVSRLSDIARELSMTLATAVLVRGNSGEMTDCAVVIGPDGVLATADKVYLWGGEAVSLTPGRHMGAVVKTEAGVVGVAICYEAGFPEVVRDLAVRGAEIIAVPAAFGRPRLHAWELMTRSRALENGCFLVAAGLTGDNARGVEFAGHSRIVGPRGEIRASLGHEEGVVVSEVDLADIERARTEIPYLRSLSQGPAHNGSAASHTEQRPN